MWNLQQILCKQPSESLRNDLVCTKPWDTLACHLFEFHGKLFLIIVDRYSKFVCVQPVVSHTIEKKIWHFSTSSLNLAHPTKYDVLEVQTFYPGYSWFFSNLDIALEFSRSYHHSSNPAERAVRSDKYYEDIGRHKLGNIARRIGLIEYLCTLISDQLPSLSEILNSRIYKGYQPFLCSSSKPELVTDKLIERRK